MSTPLRNTSPLSPVSARFPLGRSRTSHATSTGPSSEPGVRPFGLRFATTPTAERAPQSPAWRLDPHRQIAIVDDGTGMPWYRQVAGSGSMKTTGPSSDGGPSTGGEEWTPDFVANADQ